MPKQFRADLHIHSVYSDGSNTPEELLQLAKQTNLSAISITDHDTIDSYSENLQSLANSLGVYLLPGVEISTKFFNKGVHILAYGKKILCDEFRLFLGEIQQIRIKRNLEILKKLSALGILITEDELLEFASKYTHGMGKVIGRPHIALLMQKKGYIENIQDAFNLYLGDHKKCYVPGMKHHTKDVVDIIHKFQGYAVIAHPHFYKDKSFIDSLLSLPFDGIECYYSRVANFYEKKWIQIAMKKKLIITGGSDFHGIFKPNIQMGVSWVGKEEFFQLYE